MGLSDSPHGGVPIVRHLSFLFLKTYTGQSLTASKCQFALAVYWIGLILFTGGPAWAQPGQQLSGCARAGLAPIDASTPGTFEDKLLQERRVELAFENHRWFDLCPIPPAVMSQMPGGLVSPSS